MYAVVGMLLIAVGVLGFMFMMLASRKPNPSSWTQYALIQEFAAIGTVSLLSSGVASVIQSISLLKEQPLTVVQIILLVLIVIAFVFAWSRLKVSATLAEYGAQTGKAIQPSSSASRPGIVTDVAGSPPVTVSPEDPTSPTRPRTPDVPKKAA
jgi:hypothetical protein